MKAEIAPQTDVALRPASQVMRLARMGSFHQSRLSFMRVLLRRLKRENWQFDRPVFDVDENGVGVACYRAKGPNRTYTLVAFAHDLPPEMRSDRVIAEAWDATFTLYDGEVSPEDIERLSNNVPLQEAGRVSNTEIVLSRANRSVRMFDYVRDCLASGEQPDVEKLLSVGYLMRTTAVYGSSKFGAADRELWADREEFSGSFQPELLSVWLIRNFTTDLVEHLARMKSPDNAVKLDPDIRRALGVGNSTGLGMAPFLINHPRLISAWISARETALARVRSQKFVSQDLVKGFENLLKRSTINVHQWHTEHAFQRTKIDALRTSLEKISACIEGPFLHQEFPWDRLVKWTEANVCVEAQELLVSLVLEQYGELVDDLAPQMCADESNLHRINGKVVIGEMMASIKALYPWIFDVDFHTERENAKVWYVSEEKLEPRLGERFDEPLEPYEQPLSPGRDAARFFSDLQKFNANATLAEFLLSHPKHRHIARRIQLVEAFPYGEIHDNTIRSDMMPIDLLRCKLSFFGATKFDPRSDRWVRITMYQGAPFPDELNALCPDELAYPPLNMLQ